MKSLSIPQMRGYLSKSISSLNSNKLNGLLAEVDFRDHLRAIGFADRVSMGGWILRSVGEGNFARHTAIVFPETISPDRDFGAGWGPPKVTDGLQAISLAFRNIGVPAFHCIPTVGVHDSPESVEWSARPLGVPSASPYDSLDLCLAGFVRRTRKYPFLRYHTSVDAIPDAAVPEEFCKEHLRVALQDRCLAEVADIDGVFWGQQYTYPIEIKEKTSDRDRRLGEYFGLDVGPFAKLSFYAARKGNMRSLYVIREISDTKTRSLVNWWYITFDVLALCASWIPRAGGRSMQGGASSVILVPKDMFTKLDADSLGKL